MSLLKFVKSDNVNKSLELLQGAPNLHEINESDGRTVFHYALENNNLNLLTCLLNKLSEMNEFYDLNIEDHYGHTPLILSIDCNYTQGFDELLKYKLDVNYKTKNGKTALHYAAQSLTTQFLEKLIKKGGNVNANCAEGGCLHVALKGLQVENALYLLNEKEISLMVIDSNGDSPLIVAIKEGIPEVCLGICKLLECGNEENARKIANLKNSAGNTALHEAVIYKRSNLLQILKEKLAKKGLLDEKIKNKAGKTAEEIQKSIEEEEENQRIVALEKKKMNTIRSKEKQEQKRKEMIELEQKSKEEEVFTEKLKKKNEDKQEKLNKWGSGLMGIGILCILVIMYFALNNLAERKRDNYID